MGKQKLDFILPPVGYSNCNRFLPDLLYSGLLFYLLIFSGCGERNKISQIPENLNGVPLQEKLTGNDANKIISRLHGKEVSPGSSAIGYYGTENRALATLYISAFATLKEAKTALSEMSSRIGRGNAAFWHRRQIRVAQQDIHLVLGQGQIHFFYLKGKQVYWLSADTSIANGAVAQLLHLKREDIEQALH